MSIDPQEIVYKTIDDVDLTMHVFETADRRNGEPTAAIVFFFGGGWNGGSQGQFHPHCQELAERGMFAVSAEYRVKSRHDTTPIECVADGQSAVRYLREHAAELNLDPDRIAAGGGSAGGHVGACTALAPVLDNNAEVSCRPNLLPLFNPVIDTSPDGYGYDCFNGRGLEFSPCHRVTSDAPPAIVFHGEDDKCVPCAHAETFAAKMKDAGNECELHTYDGYGHGFFNYGRDDKFPYNDTVAKMIAFLERHNQPE